MATNPYFNEYIGEQNLLHDLTIETIKTMGRDMVYIPRNYVKRDIVFGEDVLSQFSDVYQIEMYIQSVTAFGNQMNLINKFGINITDKVTLQVAKRRFINALVQGVSKKGHYMFEFMRQRLERMQPGITNKYGAVMAINDYFYWTLPPQIAQQMEARPELCCGVRTTNVPLGLAPDHQGSLQRGKGTFRSKKKWRPCTAKYM